MKIHDQDRVSVVQPWSAGAIAVGPMTMLRANVAWTSPCRLGGNMAKRAVCPATSNSAPSAPCAAHQMASSSKLVVSAAAPDAAMRRHAAHRSGCRAPKRTTIQAESGNAVSFAIK